MLSLSRSRSWMVSSFLPAHNDETDGRFFVGLPFVAVEPAQIQPSQLSSQRLDNFEVWENLGEPHHIKQVAAGKASSELRLQLSRQCRDDLLPILRSLLLQDVLADTLADFPVEQGQ